ncbi:MAG: hypothetical protein ACRERD_17100 [Candidatus Binatia bacterium]
MKISRALVATAFAGVLVFSTVSRASAQDLLSSLLYGLVLGNPYGQSGGYGQYGLGGGGAYEPYGLGEGGYYEPSRGGYSDPYSYDYDRDRRRNYPERLDRLEGKYGKAMQRLDRQEHEAREKAARKYRKEERYRREMAKIDRKYDQKRYQVERNTRRDYRKLDDRFEDDYSGGGRSYWPFY